MYKPKQSAQRLIILTRSANGTDIFRPYPSSNLFRGVQIRPYPSSEIQYPIMYPYLYPNTQIAYPTQLTLSVFESKSENHCSYLTVCTPSINYHMHTYG
jgi:hypothetical protein